LETTNVTDPRRPTRRDFLGASLAGGAAIGLGALPLVGGAAKAAVGANAARPRSAKKRILILGGTAFLGPKTVEAALARGHEVTIFNRGKTEKRIPFDHPEVKRLYGNRDPELPADDARGPDGKLLNPDAKPKGLEQLLGADGKPLEFDAVIDDSGYYPRHVKASAELLSKSCKNYLYISSISAYVNNPKPGGDEDAPLAKLADPTVETMGEAFQNYGGLKALCEQAAQAAFPGRAAVIRPGYIVGPGDPTDRFTYWPVRIDRGGDVLAPGRPSDPLQWIDVRDLADFLVTLVENGTSGAFNAITPPAKWGDVLATCVKQARIPAQLVWVDAAFIEKSGMGGEDGAFPIWVDPKGDYAGFHSWSPARSIAAGMKFRPLDDTLKSLLTWWPVEVERRKRVTQQMQDDAKAKGQPPPKMGDPAKLRQGPTPEKEQELLAAWKAEQEKSKAGGNG
jgi:2'-hydroxyisoflavone reductase